MIERASNFAFLKKLELPLWRLGLFAEHYFPNDPNTCLIKLRQLTEQLTQRLAARSGLYVSQEESQYDLLRRMLDHGLLNQEIYALFSEVRRSGNLAAHDLRDDHRSALAALRFTWQLAIWYHRTFAEPAFKSGAFIPPQAPIDESAALRAELELLRATLMASQSAGSELAQQLSLTQAQLGDVDSESAFWQQMAAETETANLALAAQLSALQAAATLQPTVAVNAIATAAANAANKVQLDEAQTRELIDAQLRAAGWEVDSKTLRYANGARPIKSRNRAIAEWPTETGPADYVLFVGLTAIAAVEAKRSNIDVSSYLQQAKRYSRGFKASAECMMPDENYGASAEFRVPFVFSTNGKAFLRQLEHLSGIWFADVRQSRAPGRALPGWYTPDGLASLLKRDQQQAEAALKAAPFQYGVALRPYQIAAIQAVEAGIEAGQRAMLLAMATGTGKTKTCIVLLYRLLKAQRFKRVLFLVDRSALGEQASDDFNDSRMENLQSFADTFGIKTPNNSVNGLETSVHIATVQSMVKRLLFASEDQSAPSVDAYDCIVVDECHRGYLLDREMDDVELSFRSEDDYISKYRRVLDYFDAVKIGLTATPALHTSTIFGTPIFNYGYREAVIDGYLVDYEPPYLIHTELSTRGIHWQQGDVVRRFDASAHQIELYTTPDALDFEVDEFNRKVITIPYNEAVCAALAEEIDPELKQKTLIFCVSNSHADLVVDLLKKAFAKKYGSVDDDAVQKITGAADKPAELIRRYKNAALPNVAVTVDLLSTGIDVPAICNIVLLRRVASRILFDQMLGRATRLCDAIGKEYFRVFDAVGIFATLQNLTAMQPVAASSKITYTQLTQELSRHSDSAVLALVRDQFIAKLQRKRHHMTRSALLEFEAHTGQTPAAFISTIRAMTPSAAAAHVAQFPNLGEILDRPFVGLTEPIFVSEHADQVLRIERGFGASVRPEDYLATFGEFVRSQSNQIPALMVLLTRPRSLTRAQLKELSRVFDAAGFNELRLSTARREMHQQEIAAKLIGYIRQAAIGDALVPYSERVDRALSKILTSRRWSGPQSEWLRKIAAQTKADTVVDQSVLDDEDLLFKRDGGGFTRLNRIFNGELSQILEAFNDALWSDARLA